MTQCDKFSCKFSLPLSHKRTYYIEKEVWVQDKLPFMSREPTNKLYELKWPNGHWLWKWKSSIYVAYYLTMWLLLTVSIENGILTLTNIFGLNDYTLFGANPLNPRYFSFLGESFCTKSPLLCLVVILTYVLSITFLI